MICIYIYYIHDIFMFINIFKFISNIKRSINEYKNENSIEVIFRINNSIVKQLLSL